MINYLPSSIRHDRIHLTPYCFLPQVSIRRGICLFNGRSCVIYKLHNIVIPKRFCNSLSLALSGDYNPPHNFCIRGSSICSIRIKFSCSWEITDS
jgi:hypothetical protein